MCCYHSVSMARIARVVAPGIPHHITQRGNRRMEAFFVEADYREYHETWGQIFILDMLGLTNLEIEIRRISTTEFSVLVPNSFEKCIEEKNLSVEDENKERCQE